MPGLSQRAYAKHRGITHRAVQKAIKAGRISVDSDGTIDPERADAQWSANTHPIGPAAKVVAAGSAERSPHVMPHGRGARGDGGPEAALPPPAGGYLASRAVREAYRARREKLSFERDSGALVRLDEVRAAAFAAGRRVREHLMTMPDRIAPLVAGLSEGGECHRVIAEEIERALAELEDTYHGGSG